MSLYFLRKNITVQMACIKHFLLTIDFLIYAVHTETLDFVYYHFSTMRYIKLTFYVGKFPKIQIYG